MEGEFVDVGPPLSPAEAGQLEYELEKKGIAYRLRDCPRGPDGDRQAVQVAPADLPAAAAVRAGILPEHEAPEPPQKSRSKRLRNGLIAGVLGLVASLRLVRLVRLPKGPMTAYVVLAVAIALFAAAFGLTREPPEP